jgi:hypothetical protein
MNQNMIWILAGPCLNKKYIKSKKTGKNEVPDEHYFR